jgi:hypothetical protein
MATLADLQNRIISETTRDDLSDTLATDFANVIAKSIEQYAAERWWFNERRTLITCTPGQNWVPWPTGCRWIDEFYLEMNNGAVRYPIHPRSIQEFETFAQPLAQGQPFDYLVTTDANGSSIIKLFPTPSQAWSLAMDYIIDVTPPLVATTDANFWSNQGQDLITAQAKIRLYRDYLSATVADPRLSLAIAEEKEAYSRLRAESTRRTSAGGRLQPAW